MTPDRYHALRISGWSNLPWAVVIAHAASEALASKIAAALNASEPARADVVRLLGAAATQEGAR